MLLWLIAAALADPAGGVMPSTVAPPRDDSPQGADHRPRFSLGETWDAWGWMKARFNTMTNPPLDTAGAQADRPWWLETRFVYGVGFTPSSRFSAQIEVEEANANLAGFTDVGTTATTEPFRIPRDSSKTAILTVPRKAFLQFTHEKVGMLRIGVQTFGWGTGMLANDGAGDPVFGDQRQGNSNLRVLLATSPWKNKAGGSEALRGLSFFVAGDMVVRDDNAWLFRNDLAFAGLAGMRIASPRFDFGLFGAARWQKDRPDPYRPAGERSVTTAFPVDVYARGKLPVGDASWLTLEGEGAVITGHTTRPYLVETAADGASILSGGFVGRLRYDHNPLRLTAVAEVGFASGDNDPRDTVSRSFTFHSDHKAGLILFDQVLPLLTAHAADRASDPNLIAVPTPGARYTINQGQVSNAVYVYPTLKWRPVESVDLRVGYLGAWSAGQLYDVFLTGMNGGWNTGFGGQDASRRHMGDEALLQARWRWTGAANLAIEVGAEGAVFVPGKAFEKLNLPTQGLGRLRLDFLW